MGNDDLLKGLNDFSKKAEEMVGTVNRALPKIMENLSSEEREELNKTLKDNNWDTIKDGLAKANKMLKNIPT